MEKKQIKIKTSKVANSIRSFLLLITDKELQKIKTKNTILINSKTANEIEDLYQQYRRFIETSTRVFNNIQESYTVMESYDNKKRAHFCYKNHNRLAKTVDKKKAKKFNNCSGEFETGISMESQPNTLLSPDDVINTKKISIGYKKKLITSNNNINKVKTNDKKSNEIVINNGNNNLEERKSINSNLYNELNDSNLNLVSYNVMFKNISQAYLLKIQGTEKEKTIYNKTKNEIRKLRQLVFKKYKRRKTQKRRKSNKETFKILINFEEKSTREIKRKDTKKSTNHGSEISKKNSSIKNSKIKNRNNSKITRDPKKLSFVSVKDTDTNENSASLSIKKNNNNNNTNTNTNKQNLLSLSFKPKNKDAHEKKRSHVSFGIDTSNCEAVTKKKKSAMNAKLKTEESVPNYFDLSRKLRNSVGNRKCSNKIHFKQPRHHLKLSSINLKDYDENEKDKKSNNNNGSMKSLEPSRAVTSKNIKCITEDIPIIAINNKKQKKEKENSEIKEKPKITVLRKSISIFHPPVIVNTTTNYNILNRFSFPNKNNILNKKSVFYKNAKKLGLPDINENDDIGNKSCFINDMERKRDELNKHINNKINIIKKKHKESEPPSLIKKNTLTKRMSRFKSNNKE